MLSLPLTMAAMLTLVFAVSGLPTALSQDPPAPDQPAEPTDEPQDGDDTNEGDDAGEADVDARVAELVVDLQSDDPDTREAAEKALIALGSDALPAIKKHMAAATDDLDLRYRLEAVTDAITENDPRRTEPGEPRNPGLPFTPGGGMSITSMVSDGEGVFTMSQSSNGSIVVTVKRTGEDEEKFEFASREEFEEELPDIAAKFPSMRFGFGNRAPQQDLEPDDQRNPTPPVPMPDGMPQDLQELLERFMRGEITQEELLREMERMNPEGPRVEPLRPDERETTPRDPNEDDPNYVPNPGGNQGMPRADDDSATDEAMARVSVGGLAIEEMPAALRRQLGLTEADGGVIVAEIEDEDAYLAVTELLQWDVILTVQGLPFSDPATLAEFLAAQPAGTEITLRVYRRATGEFDVTFTR